MRKIKSIKDIIDWHLCVGCGACYSVCPNKAIVLNNIPDEGIRPVVNEDLCEKGCLDCLNVCPSYSVDASLNKDDFIDQSGDESLFGPVLEIWEGYANDEVIRYNASSGGALTALALFCLEQKGMRFVMHTGMNPKNPLQNKTVLSRNRNELLKYTGSRYLTSSPCDSFSQLESDESPVVFIGKPCDTAAVTHTRHFREKLDNNLGLVLSFFCAGVPCQNGLTYLINKLNMDESTVNMIQFRGPGWPGNFIIKNKTSENSLTYKDSWHVLQKFRPLRCHLCPDGLGQMADISCGDAWHRYSEDNNPGHSIILVRTKNGKKILNEACKAGYLVLTKSDTNSVKQAQGLLKRKPEILGRIIARWIFLLPNPKFISFKLFESWNKLTLIQKIKSIVSTIKRIFKKDWIRRKRYF